ncbi:MAG: polysaccharide deacetylase family protein [Rikenellaceae bacterium]|nr:polysaccharide deacetylase family protein [Rikenellaceae bacterium]
MTVTLGFDIEEFDFPLERGRDTDLDTQLDISYEGFDFLLGLLDRTGIKATFYTTANFALHRPEIVLRASAAGHEIASHDYCHGMQRPDPAGSRRVLEELTGHSVIGYRAPRLAATSSAELAAAGFRYDSSVNPTWIPGRYNNMFSPRGIHNDGSLVIYPTSVAWPLRVPLFWIALHAMPLPLYELLARTALHRDGHLNLYFHPWEFSDRLSDKAFGVPGYITGCSGSRLRAKFERLLAWLTEHGCRFDTTRNYLGFDE